MKMKNMKIGTQLMIGFTIILLLVVLLGLVSYEQTNKINNQTEAIYEHPLKVRRALGALKNDVANIEIHLHDIVTSKSESEKENANYRMEIAYNDAVNQIEIIRQKYLGPRKDVENVHNAFIRWNLAREKCVENILQTTDKATLNDIFKKYNLNELNNDLNSKIEILDVFAEGKANEFYYNSQRLNSELKVRLIILICIILIFSVIISYFLIRNIRRPIQKITDTTRKFKDGDRQARCDLNSENELGLLAKDINLMVQNIQENFDLTQKVSKLSEILMGEEVAREFFKKLLPVLSAETNSQMAAVYLISDDQKMFEHYESIGLADEARLSFNVESFQGEFGPVLATREIQFVKRVPIDTRFVFQTVSGKYIPREIITIPVLSGKDVIAIISLASVRTYSDQALQLIRKLQDTLSARVDGVLAYRKMRKFAEQLESQNRELELQKSELSAQSIELNEQNRELEMQKIQLSEASRLKTNFLSNMSHELRTPLNSVIALSGVLNRKLANVIPEVEYSYLEVIERNGKHLLTLINDILDISRIEAGKEEIDVSDFSTNQLVNDIVKMIQPQAKSKTVKLLVNSAEPDVLLTSDMRKCQHILQNLIGNAVKFTEKGQVEITVNRDVERVKIVVKDTGIGISESNLNHIFDEFRQADGSTSRRFGGSGLGLSIAKKYANLLGGTISVKSTLHVGSEFILSLPLSYNAESRIIETIDYNSGPKPLQQEIPVLPKKTDKDRKTILLVEDSEPAIIQMKDFLEESGYEILVARNGQEALDMIDQIIPDAMVLDLMMPGVDGFTVLKNIREVDKTADVPVLILTAKHITREDLQFLKRNNVHQLIQKGEVNRTDLMNRINSLMKVDEIKPKKTLIKVPQGKLTVLIVEDNVDNMLTVKAIVGDRYNVIEAVNGNQAIELASKFNPDFILMDIALPDFDGIEAFKVIRGKNELSNIPVFALTASAMHSDRETILSYGFDAYLVKPIDEKKFFDTINKVLYGK